MIFLTNLAVTIILWSFGLLLEKKAVRDSQTESSRPEFLEEKFLANNFGLPETEGHTSGPLKRGVADLLFLRTLLAIRQKWREQSFWEAIGSSLFSAYERKFRWRKFILSVQTKEVICMGSQQKNQVYRYPPMKHLLNNHKYYRENSHKLCHEKGIDPLLSFKKS